MRELLSEADRLGVKVMYRKLDGKDGYYDPQADQIRIDPRLSLAQKRSALAHELGHAYYRHDCSTEIAEAQAWKRGSGLAVHPDEYMAAAMVYDSTQLIARELALTSKIVGEWERSWLPRLMRAPIFLERYGSYMINTASS